MVIKNREQFLLNIAANLGRPVRTEVKRPKWRYQPQHDILKNATQDELVEVLQKQCQNIHTTCHITTSAELSNTLRKIVEGFGGESVITWKDDRYAQLGLTSLFNEFKEENIDIYEWNEHTPEENILQAEKANIGIAISEMTLAESATTVLYSNKYRGRTMNFLPKKSIVLIPKSTIIPRMTQAATHIHKQIEKGEAISSCILFMTGPSNSADIEMVLIVGVHGPVKATYIVIEDI